MSHFSKTIHYYPDLREARRFQKLNNEVHGDGYPGHISQFQELEKTIFFVMLRHVMLTRVASPDIFSGESLHVRPIPVPSHQLMYFLSFEVPSDFRIMLMFQQVHLKCLVVRNIQLPIELQ